MSDSKSCSSCGSTSTVGGGSGGGSSSSSGTSNGGGGSSSSMVVMRDYSVNSSRDSRDRSNSYCIFTE